jgi:GNAT superfamily N-acetyltransferase
MTGRAAGFHGLVGEPPQGHLEWLFVDPDAIGQGLGRLLWNDVLERTRGAGFTELEIESDRFAEPFYFAMGAVRIGATLSPVDGAELPLLRVRLGPGSLSANEPRVDL